MNKDFTRRMTHEALIILGVLAFFTFMFRLWPLLVLVIFCIIGGAIRLLFLKAKEVTVQQEAEVKNEEPKKGPTEKDVKDLAYSVILTRISEMVSSEYPKAKWIWEKPNARKLIENGENVFILLNGAGGYRSAAVVIQNLQVVRLDYITANPIVSPTDDEPEEDTEDDAAEPIPVNYELLAFEWAEAHIIEINDRCNEAVGQGKEELILMAEELPMSDAWASICVELKKASLEDVEIVPEGIKINLKQ